MLSRVSVGICKDLLVNQIAGKIRHLKVGVNRCFRVPAITTTAAPDWPNVEAEYDEDGSPAHLSVEETVIFPALRRAVSPEAEAEIVRELRARRSS